MLGFSSNASTAIGDSGALPLGAAQPDQPVVTIVSAAGRATGSSNVAAVAQIIYSAVGSCSGRSVLQGRTGIATGGIRAGDRLVITLVANPFLIALNPIT